MKEDPVGLSVGGVATTYILLGWREAGLGRGGSGRKAMRYNYGA